MLDEIGGGGVGGEGRESLQNKKRSGYRMGGVR
jgi:hypothetical protein